jgi:regulatory protein
MEDSAKALTQATGWLARREYGADELARKLQQRGFSEAVSQQTVDTLIEQGYQSDARFVESFVRSKVQRGYGPSRIKMELQQKGIGDALIGEALAAQDMEDWRELCRQAHHKRFGEVASDRLELSKQQRFLLYRGFTHDHIQWVFDKN